MHFHFILMAIFRKFAMYKTTIFNPQHLTIMFSGIVEEAAKVTAIKRDGGNVHLTLTCSFVDELR